MALETMDVTRDDLISRGLGTSALGSQRIQRMNIEELRNLRSNVAQSMSTMENEKNSRLKEVQKLVAKNGSDALRSGFGGSTGSNQPEILIQDLSASPEASQRAFAVRIPGSNITRKYKSIDEVYAALEERNLLGVNSPARVVVGGLGNLNPDEVSSLQKRGIPIVQPSSSITFREGSGNSFPTFGSSGPSKMNAIGNESFNKQASANITASVKSEAVMRDALLDKAFASAQMFIRPGVPNPNYKPSSTGDLAILANDLTFNRDLFKKGK